MFLSGSKFEVTVSEIRKLVDWTLDGATEVVEALDQRGSRGRS